jgi:hypothetical protein
MEFGLTPLLHIHSFVLFFMIKKREIVFEEVKGNLVSLMVTMRNGVHSWHLFKQVATYNLFKVTSPNVFTSIPFNNNTINSLSLSLSLSCAVVV